MKIILMVFIRKKILFGANEQLLVLNVFDTIPDVDSGNSSSKPNGKSYLNVGVPEYQRMLDLAGMTLK